MRGLRYIVTMVALMASVEAFAWCAEVNKAILMFAEQNMTNRERREVEAILGAPLCSIEFENGGKSKTHLDENGKSVTTEAADAVVRLEKAIATLSQKGATAEERRQALKTAVEMTVDIHCPGNILVAKHLEADFSFDRDNGLPKGSRWHKVDKRKWQDVWHSEFHSSHGAFSAEMYLYDWTIATKGMAKEYKGASIEPRKWAEQTGEVALAPLSVFKPESNVNRLEIVKLEEQNNMAMYRAAFRLATLLNSIK